MQLVSSDIENVVEPINPEIDRDGSQFWNPAGVLSTIVIKGTITGEAIPPTATQDLIHAIVFRAYTDNTFTAVNYEIPVWTYDGQMENAPPIDVTLNFQMNNVPADAPIALIFRENTRSFAGVTFFRFDQIDIELSSLLQFDDTPAIGHLLHETGQKIIESITDKTGVFYSEFLGRTDLNYDADGDGAYYSLHSGKQIRRLPDEYPSTSLKNFFQSLNSIFNIGLGIEYDEKSNPYVRLEKKQHFFDGAVSVTLHSVRNIKKGIAREWVYNEIEVGYKKAEYEEVNGLEEYNNKFNWTTYISTIKNKLNLVSAYRADGYGIEFARRLQFEDEGTLDTKYDNEIFIINVRKQGFNNYFSVKNEDFDIVNNILSPDSAYNLKITPGRMLRNNGSVIRAGLEKYLNEQIKFNYAEQKQNLESQETGSFLIDENADIDNDTINPSLWLPEIYTFESILTREQLAVITKYPNRLVKFSTTTQTNTKKYYYGWILSIEGNPDNELATWEILRVNANNPDLTIIDPEGSSPENPPIIVDPSIDFGVFEGRFEFIFVG
jgi:hypothetical protein